MRRAREIVTKGSVPAPPGLVMVAPPEVPRNAEGRKAKAALFYPAPVRQRGNHDWIMMELLRRHKS